VIWTSTVHAARAPGARAYIPLGALLADAHADGYFAIGFSALGGASAAAGGKPSELVPAPSDSLEAQALAGNADAAYLDHMTLPAHDGTPSRLYGSFGIQPWSRHFDAVVVIRDEVAPVASGKR
jgi:erythromycin esterase-like protein